MKPDRIFIVRHGQSVGNVDRSVYKDIPDYAIQLTPTGHQQAEDLGKNLREIIGKSHVQFYVSPFWRTRQTYAGIRKSFLDSESNLYKYYEDARIREQEWGNSIDRNGISGFNEKSEEYRDHYGHFYYRFNGGESCADVYDRVSDFMSTFFRDCKKMNFPKNVVIVTHGMTMRLFIMRWFHCSVEEFETWGNPSNASYFQLDRKPDGKYELVTPLRRHVVRHNFQFPWNDQKIFSFPHKLPYSN